jgi:hypothetical protein
VRVKFFSFVSEVSRLQYEWSSDCWGIWKSLGVNACLQWNDWRSVFVHFFCEFFEVIVDCTCALADQSLYAGIVYEHYCLCPGWPCARKSFKKVHVVYVHDETGHVCNKLYIPFSTRPPTIRPIVWALQGIAIISEDCHLVISHWTTMHRSDINNTNASPPFREAFLRVRLRI